MTIKQTDRAQIQAYGQKGIELFNSVEALLRNLVTEVSTVNYRGTNAFEFKTRCTRNAVDFAGTCTRNMQLVNAAITEATSHISAALGGGPIGLEPPSISIEMPSIDSDVSIESAEDGPLIALRDSITLSYDQIEANFAENLANLQTLGGSGGWIGPEYDMALDAVAKLTARVSEEVANSRDVMVTDITTQLESLGLAR